MPFHQVYSQGSHCSKDGYEPRSCKLGLVMSSQTNTLNLHKKEGIHRDLLTQVWGVNQSHV